MKTKINYHYTIPFKDVNRFPFLYYGVDETLYRPRVIPNIKPIIKNLKDNPASRQEVLVTYKWDDRSCLISMQFQIIDNVLIMIANFRSQCAVNGRPSDTIMLQFITNIIRKRLGLNTFKIYVNVGNYHYNPELTRIRKESEDIQKNIKLMNIKYKI